MTKATKKKLLALAKRVLTHRRNAKAGQEQKAWEALQAECIKLNLPLDASEVVEQAIDHLKRTSIAASMNSIV